MSPVARRLVETALVLVLPIACALAIAGCTRPETPPPPPPPPPAKVDEDILNGAFHECFAGDCDRAFAHLGEIAADSPVRRRDEYRAVVYRHDADRLLKADLELDLSKRRGVLEAISGSPGSDTIMRILANERLARLGAATPGEAVEVVLNAPSTPTVAVSVSVQEAAELARLSASTNPADQRRVREKLEPKIYSGKGTADDVALLRAVCRAQHDDTCLKQLDHLILN